MTGRPNSAYTLLEVVLAIGLVVGLMGSAFGFYHHTSKVRERVTEEVALARTVRVVMDRMTSELRSAIVARLNQQPMLDMNEQVIEFSTVTIPSVRAWVEPNDIEDPIPPESDVHLVTYAIDIEEDDETGEMVNYGLGRACQKLPTINRDPDGDEDMSYDILAAAIKFARFRYWAGTSASGADEDPVAQIVDDGWVKTWNRPTLPEAVEITLGTEPLTDDMDVDEYLETYETFRRVVYLPGSTPRRR